MRLASAKLLFSLLAIFGVFVLAPGVARAAGSITWSKTSIPEVNGSWHLQMTIVYGGKPSVAHVPMRFKFTPTAYFESFLDDKHGETPQKRTIPLVNQTPINESVDVGFGDVRGKIYDRTKFDFNISRSHNFAAGEYEVVVHRADGTQVGTKQKLILQGENPVIDRRAISFVSDKKKDAPAKDATAAGSTPAPAAGEAAAAPAPEGAAAEGEGSPEPASSADPPSEDAQDPTAAAKVPPGSRGCGCRVGDAPLRHEGAIAALGLVGLTVLRARRRRQAGPQLG